MSFASQDKVYVSASKGINTEGSLINFPEDFSTDEENFVITRNGSHFRRLGIDYEPDYILDDETSVEDVYTTGTVSSYIWENVSGIPSAAIAVIQEGNLLKFNQHNTPSISAVPFDTDTDINMDDFLIPGQSTSANHLTQMASGFGLLYVANPNCYPLYIYYEPVSESFLPKKITVEIRDFIGVDDSLANASRPGTLSTAHKYNLTNQGWPTSRIDSYKSAKGVYPSNAQIWFHGKKTDPETGDETWTAAELDSQHFGTSRAPRGSKIIAPIAKVATIASTSNMANIVSIVWNKISKLATIEVDAINTFSEGDVITFSGTRAYTTSVVTSGLRFWQASGGMFGVFGAWSGSTTTIKNYLEPLDGQTFTIVTIADDTLLIKVPISTSKDVFWQTGGHAHINEITEVAGSDNSGAGFSSIEFAHGRTWYAGITSAEFSSYVFFSRTLEDPSLAGICYQDADPTGEHVSDLLATDGGYITIPEAGEIYKLLSVDNNILVFASRGIWSISGKDTAFSATDYEVNKVSTVRLLGRNSVINAEGTPIFWADSGIYTMTADDVSGKMKTNSASIDSIQTLYDAIPYESKREAKVVFDDLNKIIFWLYKSEENTSVYKQDYDMILAFDGAKGAYYKHRIAKATGTYSPIIASAFMASKEFTDIIPVDVEIQGAKVEVDAEQVTVDLDLSTAGSTGLALFTAVPSATGIARTFSRVLDTTFHDWSIFDGNGGANYSSYLDSGYEVLGDLMRMKQVQYLYTFFDKTETSFTGTTDLQDEPESSCMASVKFGWANQDNTVNSWGPTEVYDIQEFFVPEAGDVHDTGFPIAFSKRKPRGAGKAIQYRFESSEGYDCRLLGWSAKLSAGTSV